MRDPVRQALDYVAERVFSGSPLDPDLRVTLNFHPDRVADGEMVIAALQRDGLYRSQFETGTSNGGLTAHPGGDRWVWESSMFGSAYDEAPPDSRPKYGALNHRRRSVGGSHRFGSCHLRLGAPTLGRATFCYPDSYLNPVHFGVATKMALVELADKDDRDILDDYIEAHVHGPIDFSSDVEAIVLDPSFHDTEVAKIAAELPCALEWHRGFRISDGELQQHNDYRGPEFVELSLALAVDGWLNAALIGEAQRSGRYDEQDLKRVWHLLARWGAPEPL